MVVKAELAPKVIVEDPLNDQSGQVPGVMSSSSVPLMVIGVVTNTAPKVAPLAEKSAVSELAFTQGENGPEVDEPQWLPVSQVPTPPTAVPLADQYRKVA